MPEELRSREDIRELESWGCATQMHVVRLLAPSLANDDHTKDIDFSVEGIRARWDAGLADTRKSLAEAPWVGEFDPLEGVILHQPPWDRAATMDAADMTILTRTDDPAISRVN
jgi:NTE family protein